VLEGCSSFEIHKYHEIGVKLFAFKIAVTGALADPHRDPDPAAHGQAVTRSFSVSPRV
jgi:hypothetical protein